jgi:hypothetical protein
LQAARVKDPVSQQRITGAVSSIISILSSVEAWLQNQHPQKVAAAQAAQSSS